MSRHSLSEPFFGHTKLKCPHWHELGAIMIQPRRSVAGQRPSLFRVKSVMKAPEITERPGGKLESPEEDFVHEGRMEWGRSVGADCEICGRPYWTFWETVEPAIARLADTPVVTLTLDDDPLC
jgi:hypothetical protein